MLRNRSIEIAFPGSLEHAVGGRKAAIRVIGERLMEIRLHEMGARLAHDCMALDRYRVTGSIGEHQDPFREEGAVILAEESNHFFDGRALGHRDVDDDSPGNAGGLTMGRRRPVARRTHRTTDRARSSRLGVSGRRSRRRRGRRTRAWRERTGSSCGVYQSSLLPTSTSCPPTAQKAVQASATLVSNDCDLRAQETDDDDADLGSLSRVCEGKSKDSSAAARPKPVREAQTPVFAIGITWSTMNTLYRPTDSHS